MHDDEYQVAVTAFIRANGITRCPTACALPTQVPSPPPTALRSKTTRQPATTIARNGSPQGSECCALGGCPVNRLSHVVDPSTFHE